MKLLHVSFFSIKGFLSLDVDVSNLEVNQCETSSINPFSEISVFHGTHKCHNVTSQVIRLTCHKTFAYLKSLFSAFIVLN